MNVIGTSSNAVKKIDRIGDSVQELIDLLCEYMQNANSPMSFWDIVITYWVPIISLVVLVTTAIGGLWKYYREKNRDFNERVLTEVYAPLYQYIVKQEFFRMKKNNEVNLNDYPLFQITKEKKITKNMFSKNPEVICEKEDVINLKELEKVVETINFGLVPHDLFVLLNIYNMRDTCDLSPEEIAEIGKRIRENIIKGYEKYRKSLDLRDRGTILIFDKERNAKFDI